MGRDKPKKYNKMGYFEKEAYKDEMAKKYGIQGTEYRDSRGNTQTRRNDKALKAAIRNDYDYRTSASHMDGVKGNASMKDFTKYERSAVKLHKQAGNGGQYSSNSDITGVTNNLVKDYRRGIEDSIKSAPEQVAEAQAASDTPEEPYVESDRLKEAKQRVQDYENRDFEVYGADSAKASGAFLDAYKLNLKN